MFLRVISNAIFSRGWLEKWEEGWIAAGRVVGRRRVVGLLAIMRSSVFRCRSASPYRYVSSPSRDSSSPRHPRETPNHPFGPARRSNGFTDSRYPQYSIFISESNFAAAAASPGVFLRLSLSPLSLSLSLSLLPRCVLAEESFPSGKLGAICSRYASALK